MKTRLPFFACNKHSDFRFPDIDLKGGEHLLVPGESGIGKTTLLHLIAGLLLPASGSIGVPASLLSAIRVFNLNISKTPADA